MTTIAKLLNISLLLFWIVWVSKEGVPRLRLDDDFIGFALLLLVPIANLYVLYIQGYNDKSWLRLLLKRKSMEEERKIKALENS